MGALKYKPRSSYGSYSVLGARESTDNEHRGHTLHYLGTPELLESLSSCLCCGLLTSLVFYPAISLIMIGTYC